MEEPGQPSSRMMLQLLPAGMVLFDDWKGVVASADRRRIQNRVNQRAARKRKRAIAKNDPSDSTQRAPRLSSHRFRDCGLWQLFASAMESVSVDRSELATLAQDMSIQPLDMGKALQSFQHWMSLLTGSPDRDCLFTLIQFNVFRAMVSNERDLGLPYACALEDDAISPLSSIHYVAQKMPPSLEPTEVQKKITHHPWIDLLPLPRMRDNLLHAMDEYNEDDLCTELLGCNPDSGGRTGIIVWGEAWDPAGWEFTEEFIHRWRWILHGCEESLASTNYWRQQRGKKALTFKV